MKFLTVLDARDKQGYKIPYGKYGIFMKVLLYQVTKNKYWLEALPDYQGKWGLMEGIKTHKISILNTIRLIKEKWLWDVNPRAALSTV